MDFNLFKDCILVWDKKNAVYLIVWKRTIFFARSNGNYSSIYTTDGRWYVINDSLKSLEQKLGGDSFRRIHKQHMIRLSCLSKISVGDSYVELEEPYHKILLSYLSKDEYKKNISVGREYKYIIDAWISRMDGLQLSLGF